MSPLPPEDSVAEQLNTPTNSPLSGAHSFSSLLQIQHLSQLNRRASIPASAASSEANAPKNLTHTFSSLILAPTTEYIAIIAATRRIDTSLYMVSCKIQYRDIRNKVPIEILQMEAARERIRAKKRQEMSVFDIDGHENSELWEAFPIVREPAVPKAASTVPQKDRNILEILTITRLMEVQPYLCRCNFTPPRIRLCGLSHGKGALQLSILRAPYP